MLEQERQNRNATTISQYRLKCYQLKDEINLLKSAIYQLSLLPDGIHAGLNKQVHNLQTNIRENRDSKKIKRSVELLVNAVSDLQAKEQLPEATTQSFIDLQINSRLHQLLNHLIIPEDLSPKLEALKAKLEKHLTIDSLTKVVDSLTDLVIEALNLEHKQFKRFLNQFANYLRDFIKYFALTSDSNLAFRQEAEEFTRELKKIIELIKNHLSGAKNVKQLTTNVENSLKEMNRQIENYREREQSQIEEYDKKIMSLQDDLEETESGAEKIKTELFSHKVRINRDSLTGLSNRIAYDEYIIGALHRWQRGFGELSLGLSDIDDLKKVNNKYGRLAGDEILKEVAAIFKSSIRAADFIGRYSGKKFIFVFERTSAYNTAKVLENLRSIIEESEFYYQITKIKITASFGLTIMQQGDTAETVFTRAEEAVQKAKQKGRNQVVTLT